MACYKININELEITLLNSNIKNEEDGLLLDNFIQTLEMYSKSSNEEYLIIFNHLKELLTGLNSSVNNFTLNTLEILKPTQSPDILPIIKANLKKLGVKLNIIDKSEFRTLRIPENIKSFVKDGEVYVLENSFSISDTTHELSHLIFGVLKVNDLDTYLKVVKTLSQHPEIKQILKNLNLDVYSSDFELDLQEESIIRFLEKIVNLDSFEETFKFGDLEIDVTTFLDNTISNTIKEIFGIQNYPGITTFLKSIVANIPVFGSNLFVSAKTESTGFRLYLAMAIKSAQVSTYIKDLLNLKIIKEGECK